MYILEGFNSSMFRCLQFGKSVGSKLADILVHNLNERGGAIPGDIHQLRVELPLIGAPAPAKTG